MAPCKFFTAMGYTCYEDSVSINYHKKTDHYEQSVTFRLDCKDFHVHLSEFIPKDSETWHAMKATMNDWDKHSCKSGHWQAQTIVDIDMRLFIAITEQIEELGWR